MTPCDVCISLLIRPEAPTVILYPVCSSCRVVPLDGAYRQIEDECRACTEGWTGQIERRVAARRVLAAMERAYEANR